MLEWLREKLYASISDEETYPKSTTNREVAGWYLYDAASAPFAMVALVAFMPLIIQNLAVQAGQRSDGSQCSTTVNPKDCTVNVLSLHLSPASVVLYTQSLSVLIQFIAFLCFGALADYGKYRKKLLLLTAFIGSLSCIAFLLVLNFNMLFLAIFLCVVSNVAYGLSTIYYNAYLPILADMDARVFALKANNASKKEINDAKDKISTHISSNGISLAYFVAVCSFLFSGIFLYLSGTQSENVYYNQIIVASIGSWWMLITFTFVRNWVKSRPGPDFPFIISTNFRADDTCIELSETSSVSSVFVNSPVTHRNPSISSMICFSISRMYETLCHCRSLEHTFRFLGAWFLFSDGYTTLVTVALQFGIVSMNMDNSHSILVLLTVMIFAVFGSYFFQSIVHHKLKVGTKSLVLFLLFALMVVPLYALMGFFISEHSLYFRMMTWVELYCVSGYYGFVVAPLQAFSRSMFAQILPPGNESEFFSLFEITDRGSSFIGPLVAGALINLNKNDPRTGFIVGLILLIFAIPVVWSVNMDKAQKDIRSRSEVSFDSALMQNDEHMIEVRMGPA